METSTDYKSKKMQYAELRDELAKLEQSVNKLNANMKTTVDHIPIIRKLGSLQSSLFMSAGSVLNSTAVDKDAS